MLEKRQLRRCASISALNLIRRRLLLAQGAVDMLLRSQLDDEQMPPGPDPSEAAVPASDGNGHVTV